MHVERRTEFVDVLPLEDLKTLLSLVKGQSVTAKDVGLAVENVASYAMGQFLPGNPVMFSPPQMEAAAVCSVEECEASLEAVIASGDPNKGMQAAPVGRIDWKNIITTVLPFILKLLV